MKLWGNDGRKRSERLREVLQTLHELKLPEDFRIVEVACGEGDIIEGIKQEFPNCEAKGVEIDDFPNWDIHSVKYVVQPLQRFIWDDFSHWDVVIMLNSYRNWAGYEKEEFDRWVKEHARYFITSLDMKVIGKDTFDHPMVLFSNRS